MNKGNSNQQSQASVLDSVLDGSVHVGNKDKIQEHSLTNLEPNDNLLTPPVQGFSSEDMQELINLRKGVEDLKWKLNYEKGNYNQMVELLQNKVANDLVKINTFEENEVELKLKTDQQEA